MLLRIFTSYSYIILNWNNILHWMQNRLNWSNIHSLHLDDGNKFFYPLTNQKIAITFVIQNMYNILVHYCFISSRLFIGETNLYIMCIMTFQYLILVAYLVLFAFRWLLLRSVFLIHWITSNYIYVLGCDTIKPLPKAYRVCFLWVVTLLNCIMLLIYLENIESALFSGVITNLFTQKLLH